jgi:uncharacterized BrkB/YihY/UPF0761 family membrane protein
MAACFVFRLFEIHAKHWLPQYYKMSRLYKNIKKFFKHYLGGLYHRLDEHHIFLLGAGLAFSFLVCSVPLVLIIFSSSAARIFVITANDEVLLAFLRPVVYDIVFKDSWRLIQEKRLCDHFS